MSATNETTGAAYQGKNVLRLLTAEAEHSYDESRGWAGFRQWLEAGRVVRKGEHGVSCLTVMTGKGEDGTTERKGVRGFRVFHYDQTVELTEHEEIAAGATVTTTAVDPAAVDCPSCEAEPAQACRVSIPNGQHVARKAEADRIFVADRAALLDRLSSMGRTS